MSVTGSKKDDTYSKVANARIQISWASERILEAVMLLVPDTVGVASEVEVYAGYYDDMQKCSGKTAS